MSFKDKIDVMVKNILEDVDLNEAIINKSSIKSKASWKKAHAALQKMEKQFKGTKKEKDYYEVLNSLFHTVDDWDDMDDEDRASYSKKTATDRTYGDDPIADLRFDLKKLLGSDSSKILEAMEVNEEKQECPKCEGEGCDHCDGKGYHEMEEAKLDAVGKEDDDVDNDGDVDDSDKYLKKRRAAISKAIKKEDKKQFMYAAKKAKEKGDAKFMFAGKEYNVEDVDLEESSCGDDDREPMSASKLKKMGKNLRASKKY